MAKKQYTWNPLTDSIVEETDGAGNVLAEYTNEPSQYGPLLSQRRNGETSYFHFDALGSTRELTDDAGAVTEMFAYDAWGFLTSRMGVTETPFQWLGNWGYLSHNSDNTSEVRTRLYRTNLGRWKSADRIFSTNLYAYSRNSPLLYLDPSGLLPGCTQGSLPMPFMDPQDAPRQGILYERGVPQAYPPVQVKAVGTVTGRVSLIGEECGPRTVRISIRMSGSVPRGTPGSIQIGSGNEACSIGTAQNLRYLFENPRTFGLVVHIATLPRRQQCHFENAEVQDARLPMGCPQLTVRWKCDTICEECDCLEGGQNYFGYIKYATKGEDAMRNQWYIQDFGKSYVEFNGFYGVKPSQGPDGCAVGECDFTVKTTQPGDYITRRTAYRPANANEIPVEVTRV